MSHLDPTLLVLLVLAALGIISHNMTVTLAMLLLLVIRITPLNHFFPVGGKIWVDYWCTYFDCGSNGAYRQWKNYGTGCP